MCHMQFVTGSVVKFATSTKYLWFILWGVVTGMTAEIFFFLYAGNKLTHIPLCWDKQANVKYIYKKEEMNHWLVFTGNFPSHIVFPRITPVFATQLLLRNFLSNFLCTQHHCLFYGFMRSTWSKTLKIPIKTLTFILTNTDTQVTDIKEIYTYHHK